MSNIRTTAELGVWIAPSAAFSIGPSVAALWNGSAALDAAVVIFLIFQTAATIGVVLASHRAGHAESWAKTLACLGLASMIGLVQFGAALDVASHRQDASAALASGTSDKRAAVAAALGAALDSRNALPQDKRAPVTEEMVTAAREAKQAECDKRGPLCRAKEDALIDITARRAITAEIDKQTDLRDKLGGGNDWIDGKAYRFGKILHRLGADIGEDDKTRTAWVMDWWPTFIAFIVELMPVLGPYATAGRKSDRPARSWRWPTIRLPRRRVQDANLHLEEVAAPAAAVEIAAVQPSAATAAKPRKSKVSKAAALPDAGSVVQWHQSRTVARAGSKLKPKDTWETAYLPWCAENSITPVSFTVFGTTMKKATVEGGCGVVYDPDGFGTKRGAYLGIALAGGLALVKAG